MNYNSAAICRNEKEDCPECNGTGKFYGYKCIRCFGIGKVDKPKPVVYTYSGYRSGNIGKGW